MTVAAVPIVDPKVPPRRFAVTPAVELAVIVIAVIVAFASWRVLASASANGRLISPPLVAMLLTANLIPAVALVSLIGRRIAIARASRASLAGGGRLHVRLVAVFSLMASIPIVLTVVAASIMFQSGVQLWGSERARDAFASTIALAKQGQAVVVQRWTGEAVSMAGDIRARYTEAGGRSQEFHEFFLRQTFYRNLYQSVLFRVSPAGKVEAIDFYEPPDPKIFAQRVSGQVLNLLTDRDSYTNFDQRQLWVVTPVDRSKNVFLYVATPNEVDFLNRQSLAADKLLLDYEALQRRTRSVQMQFNAILFGVALLIVGLATWIALGVADRLVRPVDQLVTAADKIAGGDLTTRVAIRPDPDEIGALGLAFNGMTARLQKQTDALVSANAQLESRRALIEAVLSGVTAGVIAVGGGREVRLVNSSALALIAPGDALVGRSLADVAPDLEALLASGAREGVVQINASGEARTLAVKITRDEDGHVLTFDDITQQLLDQRRAAWSDVARRIAHEIKNPLTPIQLAAERLQRRYGKLAPEGDTTFGRLTDTIVRQVGDLRRMVDEFSSFARMPKPVFREESLVDLARQAVFLHEVAHPAIRFALIFQDPPPNLVCDRRQIGQALTNLVKNAVEAIEARTGDAVPVGEITVALTGDNGRSVGVQIADNGIGLPVERDRIVEPYMTTRSRGTGLGLAIVKKIVEEHFGSMLFVDRPGGGTVVTLAFDAGTLATLVDRDAPDDAADPSPAMLTRTRTTP
ncbi:ATP-binding protein [Sphingomonas donggukensis]|uniref:histidine kinase n=1 Tax=Sphingomonas donggukensis TaxID=2949093 RepID=A0ABY4TW53_9SPHN|nr:ATP-binding protein [Sphingomonas donggukensis]URW76616.1 ATP-binding protein [Sphingomonas donggukensis]